MKSLQLFLPHVASYQVEDLGVFQLEQSNLKVEPLTVDWQSLFCQSIGTTVDRLPWTEMRLSQINASKAISFACCCDSVLVQLTHRGAYTVGQEVLQLSEYHAERIVAQINEQLLGDGESLHMIDAHSWLYLSSIERNLSSLTVNELIGKDSAESSYLGKDSDYWRKLSAEIQMLIKYMTDYQGGVETPPEMLLNVHFSDPINPLKQSLAAVKQDHSLTVVTDNEQMKQFCFSRALSQAPLSAIHSLTSEKLLVILLGDAQEKRNNREYYKSAVEYWFSKMLNSSSSKFSIICQDAKISVNKPHFLTKLVRWITRK